MTGAEAVARLPAQMRIGAFDFMLQKWGHVQASAAHRYGECSTHEMVIRIREDMSHSVKALDTLIHETNHAIFWVYGVEDDDKEERTVNLISTGWAALYRDNPWLLDWIRDCLTP